MSDFVQKRLDICNACEHMLKRPNQEDSCGLCGCWIRLRTPQPEVKCPLDPPKWEAEGKKKG